MHDSPLVIEHAHPSLHLDETALEHLVRYVLESENHTLRYLGIILADHNTVLELNQTYLAHDYLTDVLSFSLSDTGEDKVVDGEVYVDLDTAAERHAEFNVSFEEEARRYVLHGLLHLMGYDDATPDQKRAMRRLENRYLAACP
ncbi:MAG: rRNA maturation RNase YbeY [Rhodothermales bacterium]